jgi:transposase
VDSEKNYRVSYYQKVEVLVDIFGAKDVHTGKIYYKFYDWKNSFIVIDFVDWLLKNVFPNNEIYLIHDNWSAHKSNVFKGYADLQPRSHLVSLPTTCSWMNPIERDFSKVQVDVIDNSNFKSVKDAIKAISEYFERELNSN